MNVVMTGDGRLIEVQATAESTPFSRSSSTSSSSSRRPASREIVERQREALAA